MTKRDIFVFANNFVVLLFSSLEEEVTCLTDVKKETEREKKWETLVVFLGVKRVNNRAYWGCGDFPKLRDAEHQRRQLAAAR